MNKNIFFILLLILTASCGRSIFMDKEVKDIINQLDIAYESGKKEDIEKIFHDWNEKIVMDNEAKINQNDTIKEIYAVFKEIYKPFDLQKLGDWEGDVGDSLNIGFPYVIVQESISYVCLNTDSLSRSLILNYIDVGDKIQAVSFSFCPPLNNTDKSKILYANSKYIDALEEFLGNESIKVGEENIMMPSLPKGISKSKYEFLRKYIPINHGHWGGWHITTHPKINKIYLNKKLDRAYVFFRVLYEGGEAELEKVEGKWEIKRSNGTLIE